MQSSRRSLVFGSYNESNCVDETDMKSPNMEPSVLHDGRGADVCTPFAERRVFFMCFHVLQMHHLTLHEIK